MTIEISAWALWALAFFVGLPAVVFLFVLICFVVVEWVMYLMVGRRD